MRKNLSLLFLLFFFLPVSSALCLDITVDIKGPQELVSLKEGISRTIHARCLAKNLSAEEGTRLNVSLIQLGDTLSLDAVLDTSPPRAFHKDLKGSGELSAAIDQMLADIFAQQGQESLHEEKKPARTQATKTADIKLPFTATSLTVIDGTVFVSSEDSIYRIEGKKPQIYWKSQAAYSILRLFPYQGSVLAVCSRDDSSFTTFIIKDGKIAKKLDRCVVPLGDGLIGAAMSSDHDIPDGLNKWTRAETVEGSPLQVAIPEGQDILSMLISDVFPETKGEEITAFDKFNRITVKNGGKALWTSDTEYGSVPLYVISAPRSPTTKESAGRQHRKDPQERYYLMPRIIRQGKDIITFANEEGVTKFLGNIKLFDSARVVLLSPEADEPSLVEKDLALIRNYYCADVALDRDSVLALIVKKSTSSLQRIDLQ